MITYFWLPWVIVVVPGLLTMVAYLAVEHKLCCLRHVGSSRTQELTRVSCTGRWILIHCTTSEVLAVVYLKLSHFHIWIHSYYNVCGFVYTLLFMHGIKNTSRFLHYVVKKKKKTKTESSYQSCIGGSKQGALRLVKHSPTPRSPWPWGWLGGIVGPWLSHGTSYRRAFVIADNPISQVPASTRVWITLSGPALWRNMEHAPPPF